MNLHTSLKRPTEATIPRAEGSGYLKTKLLGQKTVLDDFRCGGSLKILFPRSEKNLEAVLINTSGGLTSGDVFSFASDVEQETTLTLTTQAAERAYRAETGQATVRTTLSVQDNGTLKWLPQELILFDGCHLDRTLTVELGSQAEFLMVEPVIFGRAAMGEAVRYGTFKDTIKIRINGELAVLDRVRLEGNIAGAISGAASMSQGLAMANLIYVSEKAESGLASIRGLLGATSGASLIADTVLAARFVAADGFELRKLLMPALEILSNAALPRTWRL